jgi:class 3 adenylate cyclase
MPGWPTGTVTFLFTDVEGSTRHWEEHPAAMRAALARHDALIEAEVAGHEGTVVRPRGEGDSRFAVFARASDAVAAAAALQRALSAEPWPPEAVLRVRMALHTGEADLREGDYYGSAVNRCARLRAIAHGGQTLLSAATAALVWDSVPSGASLRDLGEHRLADLQRPEHVFQLDAGALPAEFPPVRSLEASPNNLPVQLTSFIGREEEIAEVTRLVRAAPSGARLLTLTGAGGAGKTRLAVQVAAGVVEDAPDGVWYVELAPLADPALLPQAVASTCGVRETPGRSLLASLCEVWQPRHVLLILDNCEHLLDACAALADTLLRHCPHLSILATSREPLGIGGETTWRVPSLAPPPQGAQPREALTRYAAVQLFVERAVAVRPDFAVTEANAPVLAQICARLDGIPLAIELAAARMRGLAVEQVAARLDQRFRLLTGGSRTALPRQQTLRGTGAIAS